VKKVVITDCDLGPCDIEKKVLAEIAEVYTYQCRTEEEVKKVAKDADGIIVQYAPITRSVIESLEKCKVISRYGIGVDNIDVKASTEHGIFVVNVTDYCIDEVADHTIALLLACTRKIVFLDNLVKNGIWNVRLAAPIYNLNGKTMGLIGFGSIAKQVSLKVLAFGLNIIAYDPYVSSKIMKRYKTKKVNFRSLLKDSDIISLHLSLTAETRHMIGEKELKMMKRTAFLINTSRGALIDESALYRALNENWIEGAGIDVVENEPLNPESDLLMLKNIVITPHSAFFSNTSLKELQRRAAVKVAEILKGRIAFSLVNK